MHHPEPASEDPSDRRRAGRRPWEGKLSITIDPLTLEGETDNVSSVGVLLYTGADVRVSVALEQPDGSQRVVSGKLVRLQRISEHSNGLAVEFDRYEPGMPGDPSAW